MADRVGGYASSYGARALVVVGDTHARASGALARIEGALRSAGMAVELFEGVPGNPSVAIVDAGATLARVWRADVLVGVGGGSVLDTTKAIATIAATSTSHSFREHLSGIRRTDLLVDAALPVVAVPTLMGSGSETNGTSVITDDETGRKLGAHDELAAPRVALLDPLLVRDAPRSLLGAGLADAVCHALEAGCSTRATIASDALAEQALRMLRRDAGAALDLRADATLLRAWWATNLAGEALTLAGSILTHPLAHPLSARLDAHHGAAVAALEPAVLVALGDRLAAAGALTKLAEWLDVRSPNDPGAALRGILNRFAKLCADLDVRDGVTELGVTEGMVDQLVRDARASGSRGLANVPGGEPTPDELFAILDLARAATPASPAKRWMDAKKM